MRKECRHIATTWVKSALRRKPLYGLVGFNLWMRVNQEKRMSLTPPVGPDAVFAADLATAKHRLANIESLVSRQRAIAEEFRWGLKLERAMICFEKPGAFYNRLQFPITFESQRQRDFMADFLLTWGVDSVKYLDDVVATAGEIFSYDNDCPNSERLSKQVLVIPNQHSLGEKDVRRVIAALNAGWTELGDNEFSNKHAVASNPQPSLIPISK
jgi:Predicted pyridoxal phosphate-dependent enzyme apparently involved in regulation of cell wall biogenesis